jgi:purine-binding chemotaxis protein CheW
MSHFDNHQAIDWKALWEELGWDDETKRGESTQKRLKKRAQQYALSLPDQDAEKLDKLAVLVFELGSEFYAVDVGCVRTVRLVDEVSPVPGTPDFYPGVMNVRGQIITLIDLRLFFGVTIDTDDVPGELIVVEANDLTIGLLAHHVRDVTHVPRSTAESMDDVRYAYGVTAEKLVLLDIVRMFEDNRLIAGDD